SNYNISTIANSENYEPGAGVIYVVPSSTTSGGLFVPTAGTDEVTKGATIYIKDSLITDTLRGVVLHEIGHTIYGPAKGFDSVMGHIGITYYTALDIKGTKLIYENTYHVEDWENSNTPVEHLKYILGKSFDVWGW
ncbi:MAG: hypothetical protein J7L72_10400, partial [Candidatus Aminicenantes bacterium]|nr:hypothetical protein [Candidatus Aminicenantes bacterium]